MNDPQALIDSVNILPKLINTMITIVCVCGLAGFAFVAVRSFLSARARSNRYRR